MQYRYKKPKEKQDKKTESKMKVVVEKNGAGQEQSQGQVRLMPSDLTSEKESKELKRSAISSVILLLVVAAVCGFIIYANNYYHTSEYPDHVPEGVDFVKLDNGCFAFVPENPIAGLIFYPEDKVEFSAYEELMIDCAHNGILCVLVKMPFNMSSLNPDAAEECMALFPDIGNWYVGGHSSGGFTASEYASENSDKLKGLILLASYSTKDISDTSLSVLSVYGSEDGVLNMKKYEKNLTNLPADTTEIVIEGGCHSYFGNYGMQKKDGTPSIERSAQIDETVTAIRAFVMSGT